MGYSPFFMNYGIHPHKGQYTTLSERSPEADKFTKQMQDIWDTATHSLEKVNESMKKSAERKGVTHKHFIPGQKVLVSTVNFPSQKHSTAFAPKFKGPFEIVEQIGPAAYKVKLPLSWKIHDVFHESLLKEYQHPEFPNQKEQERDYSDGRMGNSIKNTREKMETTSMRSKNYTTSTR